MNDVRNCKWHIEYSFYTSRTNNTYKALWNYNADQINVKIFDPDDLNNYAYIIDRKNLEVRDVAGAYRFFPRHCELIVYGNQLWKNLKIYHHYLLGGIYIFLIKIYLINLSKKNLKKTS